MNSHFLVYGLKVSASSTPKNILCKKKVYSTIEAEIYEKSRSTKSDTPSSEHLALTSTVVLFFLWWHCDKEIIFHMFTCGLDLCH